MKETFAPYAPPSAVMAVIHFYRKRDVPASVTLTSLQQIGVTEALAPRTMAALKFLSLLNDDGTTTEQFRAIRYASDDDYQQVLTGILEAAYREVLDHLDLSTAGDRELNNAFIPYSPGGQRPRMITLFQALAQEAGWPLAVTPKASSPRSSDAKQRSAPKPKGLPRGRGTSASGRSSSTTITPPEVLGEQNASSGLRLSVTDTDLAVLSEADFDTVWSALGLLQKARRQSLKAAKDMADEAARRRANEAHEDK
jgi:hypothetical protein